MNILITGANGQLGNEMRVLSAAHPQHTYFFTDVQELDICDADAVRAFIADRRVDVVVNLISSSTARPTPPWTRPRTILSFVIV